MRGQLRLLINPTLQRATSISKRNYYKILGTTKNASADEIKKAYRRKAKELHPDSNRDNSRADAQFKELGEAYDVLKDANKRAVYDLFSHGQNQTDEARREQDRREKEHRRAEARKKAEEERRKREQARQDEERRQEKQEEAQRKRELEREREQLSKARREQERRKHTGALFKGFSFFRKSPPKILSRALFFYMLALLVTMLIVAMFA